jgi:hypothetical protein
VALVRTKVLEEWRFLQEAHGITFQKMAFFNNKLFIKCHKEAQTWMESLNKWLELRKMEEIWSPECKKSV